MSHAGAALNASQAFSFAVRRRRGAVPLGRVIRYENHAQQLSDRINFNLDDVRAYGGADGRADEFFRVIIKPFMDAYTYDQDRIEECCIHLIRPGGSAVSFCRFNTIQRGRLNHKEAETWEELHGAERACT